MKNIFVYLSLFVFVFTLYGGSLETSRMGSSGIGLEVSIPGFDSTGVWLNSYINRIGIGNKNRRIVHYDYEKFKVLTTKNSGLLEDTVIAYIADETKDELWIAGNDRRFVIQYRGDSCNYYDTSTIGMSVSSPAKGVGDIRWFEARTNGEEKLLKLDGTNSSWTIYDTSNSGLSKAHIFNKNLSNLKI